MSDEVEITEGTQVKIDSLDSRDSWFVLAVTGEGDQERFHLAHVEYSNVTREVCRDRLRMPTDHR